MENLIKKVWTDSHGTIQRASPAGRWVRPRRPLRRVVARSATSTVSARTVWRVRFRTFIFEVLCFNLALKIDVIVGVGDAENSHSHWRKPWRLPLRERR